MHAPLAKYSLFGGRRGGEVANPNCVLLAHGDNVDGLTTFIDSTGRHTLDSRIDVGLTLFPEIDTAQLVFGPSSILFPRTGAYPDFSQIWTDGGETNSDFAYGSGDYTVDGRFRFNDFATNDRVWDQNSELRLVINSSQLLIVFDAILGTLITGTTVIATNTWYHIALVRVGGVTKLFLNGVQEGSDAASSSSYTAGGPIQLANPAGCWIDEFRVLKGEAAWSANFTPKTVPYAPPLAGAAYTGPGDVVSGATAWWGLRAYSSGKIGTNAVRLRRSSDNVERDFATIENGGLPLDAISAFKGASSLFVTKLYDQTGNGFHLPQSFSSLQPPFTLSGLGSLPIIQFSASHYLGDISIRNLNMSVPFIFSGVAIRPVNSGRSSIFVSSAGSADNTNLDFSATNNQTVWAFDGSDFISSSANDNVWHAIQAFFESSSNMGTYIDGASNTINPASTMTLTNTYYSIGPGVGYNVANNMTEFGLWATTFSSGQKSDMNSNQHAYWGF